jgi:hypothetical protein
MNAPESKELTPRSDSPDPAEQVREEPYFIEVDTNGCGHCGAGRTWLVVGPDGYGGSQSFEDEEDAAHLAQILNDAYWMGRGRDDSSLYESSQQRVQEKEKEHGTKI